MTRRHLIAIAVSFGVIVLALAQPLWIRTTGEEVALGIRPIDPLSFFRGNYVDLAYDIDVPADETGRDIPHGSQIYVVFDDARPANALRIETSQPTLAAGETCIRGVQLGTSRVALTSLEQFFVTPAAGARLERNLSGLVGVVKTTGSCRAILVSLEPIDPTL